MPAFQRTAPEFLGERTALSKICHSGIAVPALTWVIDNEKEYGIELERLISP